MKKFIIYIMTWFTIILFLGFGIFVRDMYNFKPNMVRKTDAIITLTGANRRIDSALCLYSKNLSDHIFISGVNKDAKLTEIVSLNNKYMVSDDRLKNIEFDNNSIDTITNALESNNWILRNNIKSIRLVTHNYHMRRSIFEFKKLNKNLIIIPHPIQEFEPSVKIMFKEYLKFITRFISTL